MISGLPWKKQGVGCEDRFYSSSLESTWKDKIRNIRLFSLLLVEETWYSLVWILMVLEAELLMSWPGYFKECISCTLAMWGRSTICLDPVSEELRVQPQWNEGAAAAEMLALDNTHQSVNNGRCFLSMHCLQAWRMPWEKASPGFLSPSTERWGFKQKLI